MIGVDIVDLERFRKAIEGSNGERLIRKIYTDSEIDQCGKNTEDRKLQALAGRFVVKEAVIKASKGGLTIANMKQIEVRQHPRGFLDVFVLDMVSEYQRFEASISHDGNYVIGVAIRKL